MSYFQKMHFKYDSRNRKKENRIRRIKQAKLPKPPKDYNGSKSIPGKFPVVFKKASEL